MKAPIKLYTKNRKEKCLEKLAAQDELKALQNDSGKLSPKSDKKYIKLPLPEIQTELHKQEATMPVRGAEYLLAKSIMSEITATPMISKKTRKNSEKEQQQKIDNIPKLNLGQ